MLGKWASRALDQAAERAASKPELTNRAPRTSGGQRMYAGARSTRMTAGFGNYGNSSADSELSSGLVQMRSRSRQLMRDAPYAKRARVIIVNNVIGTGVGIQAQVKNTRDEAHTRINDDIEAEWREWCCSDSCHTGGAMHMSDLERAFLSEVVTAGEVFVRLHPGKFGDSEIPLALELIEAERVIDDMTAAPLPFMNTNVVRMGVEQDEFGRPIAYWIRERHPNELRLTPEKNARVIRVPASEIIHIRVIERWPQTRGEPWLHAVIRKLNDADEYTASELQAARLSANYFATLKSPEGNDLATTTGDDGSRQMDIEGGTIEELPPGTELDFHTPNRPNAALDPFLRYMLREIAAGTGVSYESISRDYSQSNYSSSRLALLDDRDLWRVLQQWWVRSFRERLHKAWLDKAVLSRAIASIPVDAYALDPSRYTAVRWKLRGWTWIDPLKEVGAYNDAIAGNLTTVTDVIEATGNGSDLDDYIEKRKAELAAFEAAGIVHAPVTNTSSAAKAAQSAELSNTNETPAQPARVINFNPLSRGNGD